jgi:hypothetical protein
LKFRPHIIFAVAVLLCVSCRTAAPLPPADFSAPGWHVQQGQAVWKPAKSRPELAGDLLVATNNSGDYMIQFSKTPFMLATAQVASNTWRIQFGNGQFSWSGHGNPPARFSWFQLPRCLNGAPPARPWKVSRKPDDSWHLENPRTGEALEGVLFP